MSDIPTKNRLQGMDTNAILRYAAARKQIDESADLICCISSVFSVFEDWGDDRVAISAFALGKLNDLANRHACRILEALEDFAPASEARDFAKRVAVRANDSSQDVFGASAPI